MRDKKFFLNSIKNIESFIKKKNEEKEVIREKKEKKNIENRAFL